VIKRKSRTIPFGYKLAEDEGGYTLPDYIEPIESELQALEEAKKFLKTCSYREVAIWLSAKTKRYISYVGLRKRVTRDSTSKAEEKSKDQSQAVS
jgi:hypothetical protein